MARFYCRTAADTKTAQIKTAHRKFIAEVLTYNSGVRVEAVIGNDEKEVINIYRTSGSSSANQSRLIGYVKDGEFHREIKIPSIVPDN